MSDCGNRSPLTKVRCQEVRTVVVRAGLIVVTLPLNCVSVSESALMRVAVNWAGRDTTGKDRFS